MPATPDPGVERLVCHYPLVHRCNVEPVHFLHGFTAYLSEHEAAFHERILRNCPGSGSGDVE